MTYVTLGPYVGSIPLAHRESCAVRRHDISGVPGAFLLSNVLDHDECLFFIAAAEAMKYTPDAVDGIDNITLIADEHLAGMHKSAPAHVTCTFAGLPPYYDTCTGCWRAALSSRCDLRQVQVVAHRFDS